MIIDLAAPLPMECPEYLCFVRALPSAASGRFGGIVAHHRIGGRYSTRKTSDFEAMALTDDEHRELHDIGPHAFAERHGKSESDMVKATLLEAMRLGVLQIDKRRARALSV
ncbi:MAG: DUF968 domain-containing protein [Polycyclovorans sp.]|nr:DUF968 domain-containing protein [Polycyclovorans sp.]